ncbi:MAG: serine hydrolase domain-containing protein [Anaerovorax sp.]|nr:serine hydrolase domain-containing protein [Anaerovorax sp.]
MSFDKCEKIFDRLSQTAKIHEAIAYIENTDGSISWNKGYHRTIDSTINMASITKLFTTTCILILCEQGKLSLNDKIKTFLDKEIMNGLHVYKGIDYSNDLRISDLMFQVSGLPDYFLEGNEPFEKKMLKEDFYVDLEEMIAISKTMNPKFAPRMGSRSYYADINFDLLGKIIEIITQKTLSEVLCMFIFKPLNLKSTYIVTADTDYVPNVYYKEKKLSLVKFLRSCPASGGGVTTARELMIFIKAFWGGQLFNKQVFEQLQNHKRLQITFGGIHYAGGYMYLKSGMLFIKKNQLVGHSGSTGSYAFYCPETDLFFVGDVNQGSSPSIPIRLLLMMEMNTRNILSA